MSNPWDVLPLAAHGDQEDSILYEKVGRALTQWENLEGTLGRIFGALCGARMHDEGAVRAFGVVAASSARLDMIEAAFAVFPGREKEGISALPAQLKRVGNYSARRNEIAHGVVSGFTENGAFRGYYLVPAYYNSRKRSPLRSDISTPEEAKAALLAHGLGKYAYNSAQVDAYRQAFFHLNDAALGVDMALTRLGLG